MSCKSYPTCDIVCFASSVLAFHCQDVVSSPSATEAEHIWVRPGLLCQLFRLALRLRVWCLACFASALLLPPGHLMSCREDGGIVSLAVSRVA